MSPDADQDAPRASEPSLRALLLANLRVVGFACALAVLAYGVWRGLAALFPELTWLQPG